MKNRKKYFVAHYVTDCYYQDDEYEMFYAESEEAVKQEIEKILGEHLIACVISKATWAERRQMKK
jgi:hypothetical protein